ncbi:MAG TPA: ABC transporter permease [Terriglobales bacterium]
MSRGNFFETTWQDTRYSCRAMRKNPAFYIAVLLTIALGIGSNTAMFSVIHAVLLKPLAYREPGRVMLLSNGATLVRFDEMRAASQSFAELGAYSITPEEMALSGNAQPEVLNGARVSANFLKVLGLSPLMGRGFFAQEDVTGAPPVAMISSDLWRRRFASDAGIVGKSIMLEGEPHTIVGVLPPGFQFPYPTLDVWVTKPSERAGMPPQSRPISPILNIFGRLKPGVNIQQANAELTVLTREYAAAHPAMLDARHDPPDTFQPLKDALVSDVRSKLWMLFGAVGFVLLIVCANIGSLLLARATSRSREFAVRAAIGAGRGRIVRQLLVESSLLALAGGLLGTTLAAVGLRILRGATFVDLPRAAEIRLDGAVLGFALAASLITGLLFGLMPSLIASRPDLAGVLRGSGEDASSSRSARWFGPRGLLVVGQVALSVVLLIGASLLIESLARLNKVDPGFQSTGILTMKIALPPARYDTDAKKTAFYQELVQRVEAQPGVRSAAITWTLPMTGYAASPVQLAAEAPRKLNERPIGIIEAITPKYFQTMGIALRRGRAFTQHDDANAPAVVIINESLARVFWPQYPDGIEPVGQNVLVGIRPQPVEIVGVVADVLQAGKNQAPDAGMYLPYAQRPPQAAMLAVRTDGDPLSFANAIRNQVLSIDRDQPVSAVSTMDEVVEASEGQLRLIMRLLGIFAAAATLLTIIGLYGVISYTVVQRTKEIGIRTALGAQKADVLRLVLGQGLWLALSGVALGVAGGWALTRVMKDLLFQVSATDPATFLGISILFLGVALAASYLPARRAAGIDPLITLRI